MLKKIGRRRKDIEWMLGCPSIAALIKVKENGATVRNLPDWIRERLSRRRGDGRDQCRHLWEGIVTRYVNYRENDRI
jgi:hypothetical protein